MKSDKKAMQLLWDKGMSIQNISNELSINYWKLRREMISHGIIGDRDAIGRYNKERDTAKEKEIDEIKKMISDGKSIKEIAKEMGVHYKSIYRKLKKD